MTQEVPLIHTMRGNMPISDLQYETRWEITEDYVKMIEVYSYQGEPVRTSAHVLAKKPMLGESQTAALN